MESEFEMPVHIRWMVRSDMTDILDIEIGNFKNPWSEEDFLRCLRQRNCIGMVAEYGERVVGFMIYELHKDQIHVLNFSVRPDVRRRHIGKHMVNKLVRKLSQQRRNKILLEIRETNLDGLLFFRKQGFKAIDVLRDYYADSTDDAIVMQYRIQTEFQREFEPTNRITEFMDSLNDKEN